MKKIKTASAVVASSKVEVNNARMLKSKIYDAINFIESRDWSDEMWDKLDLDHTYNELIDCARTISHMLEEGE